MIRIQIDCTPTTNRRRAPLSLSLHMLPFYVFYSYYYIENLMELTVYFLKLCEVRISAAYRSEV